MKKADTEKLKQALDHARATLEREEREYARITEMYLKHLRVTEATELGITERETFAPVSDVIEFRLMAAAERLSEASDAEVVAAEALHDAEEEAAASPALEVVNAP